MKNMNRYYNNKKIFNPKNTFINIYYLKVYFFISLYYNN